MARPLRLELAGGLYHVTSRGDRREIFGVKLYYFYPKYILINGDCVIVTSSPNNEVEVKSAKSGGWLEVETSPCGLF